MTGAFYIPEEDAFVSSELTRGPWSAGSQHGGPPAALLARAIERLPGEPSQVGSIAFDILRPVPIERLRVDARVVRPGRRVDLSEAELSTEEGDPVMRARAWRIARLEASYPEEREEPLAPPSAGSAEPFFPRPWDAGFHTAMEWRFIEGAWLEPGPSRVWLRMLGPLVEGEQPTPLERLLVAADCGNGVSAAANPDEHLFINVDLSVHLYREPAGEWVGLDARTHPGSGGRGLAESRLFDERGPLGRACQSLLMAPR